MLLEYEAQLFAAKRHISTGEFFDIERLASQLVDAEGLQQIHPVKNGIAFLASVVVELLEREPLVFISEMAHKALT